MGPAATPAPLASPPEALAGNACSPTYSRTYSTRCSTTAELALTTENAALPCGLNYLQDTRKKLGHLPQAQMASRRLLRAAAAGAIFAAATLSSCSSSAGAGPLWQPMDHATQCVPARGHTVLTDGLEPIHNRASTTAVIDKVAFSDPKGLRVIRSYVVPDTGSLYGVLYGYPPLGAAGFNMTGFRWKMRQNADGATLPHRTRMNLLLVFKLVAGVARATAAGIDIWYHVGAAHYHFRFQTALVVLTNRWSCS